MALSFDPRFTIEDPNTNTYNLWVTQDTEKNVTNDLTQTQIPYQQPSNNINYVLGQEEEISLSGVTTYDVADQSNTYSDGELGLAEWAQDIFSITGAQGQSHTITDNLDDESFSGYVKRFNIQLGYPRSHRINWDIQLVRGQGLVPYQPTSSKTASPGQTATLDGYDLGSPVSFSMSKNVATDTTVIPDPSGDKGAEQNFVRETGVSFRFDISFKTRRNQLINDIRDMRELNKSYTLQTPFPGATYDVQIDDLSVNRDTENPADWDLTVVQ